MQLSAIAKGIAIGAAAGMAGYLVSNASENDKNRLKRRTGKAAHAIGAMLDSAADLFK